MTRDRDFDDGFDKGKGDGFEDGLQYAVGEILDWMVFHGFNEKKIKTDYIPDLLDMIREGK